MAEIVIQSRTDLSDQEILTIEYTYDGEQRAAMISNWTETPDAEIQTDYDDTVGLSEEELIEWIETNKGE